MNKITLAILLLVFISSCAHHKTKEVMSFDSRLSNFEYPFPVKFFSFDSQKKQLEMSYMDIGEKTAKKTIVLLHGKNFSGFYWKRIAEDLLKKGHRVIIPDQIGFGKSTKPDYYQYSFTGLALNTKRLLDSLKIQQYTIIGHSMGGMLGVTMAYMFEKQIEQLVLINPIGLETYLDYVKFKDINTFYEGQKKTTAHSAREYQKRNYYDGKWSPEYEKLLIPIIGQLNGEDWDLIAWNNALTYGPIFSEDIVARMTKVKVPMNLIIGTRDKTGPGRGWKKDGVNFKLGQYKTFKRKFRKLIPEMKTFELEGLGHMPQFENYKLFSKVFYKLL